VCAGESGEKIEEEDDERTSLLSVLLLLLHNTLTQSQRMRDTRVTHYFVAAACIQSVSIRFFFSHSLCCFS
jgi:hypothetical protein